MPPALSAPLSSRGAARSAPRCQAARPRTAAVVGAGPAGLAAAIALRDLAGVADVTVYERASDLSAGAGTGVAIWPNGMRALGMLDERLAESLEGRGCEILGALGPDMSTTPFPLRAMSGGVPGVMVKWRALQQVLLDRFGEDGVRLGVKVESVSQEGPGAPVVLRTAAHGTVEADCVVGADGVRSAVRAAACAGSSGGGTVLDGGRRLVRAVVPRAALEGSPAAAYPPGCTGMWRGAESGATIGLMDVGEADFYFAAGVLDESATAPSAETSARDVALAVADEAAASQDEMTVQLASILRAAALASDTVYDGRSLSRPPQLDAPWADALPGLTLCGDAMHAVVPSFGQGACLALEDAVVLGRQVARCREGQGGPPLEDALRAYEAARLPRTAQAQVASWKSGEKSYGRPGDEYDHLLPAGSPAVASPETVSQWLMAWDGTGEGEGAPGGAGST